MNLNITTNLDDVRRRLAGLERQVNFAASKALNDTAREVRKAIPAGLRRSLDRPTPFTASEGATFIRPARRDNLTAEVLFKDRQASYLRFQVEGGVRRPTRRAEDYPLGTVPHGGLLLTMQSADMWTDPLWAATTSPEAWAAAVRECWMHEHVQADAAHPQQPACGLLKVEEPA